MRQAVSQVVLLKTFPVEQELHSLVEGPVHALHFTLHIVHTFGTSLEKVPFGHDTTHAEL